MLAGENWSQSNQEEGSPQLRCLWDEWSWRSRKKRRRWVGCKKEREETSEVTWSSALWQNEREVLNRDVYSDPGIYGLMTPRSWVCHCDSRHSRTTEDKRHPGLIWLVVSRAARFWKCHDSIRYRFLGSRFDSKIQFSIKHWFNVRSINKFDIYLWVELLSNVFAVDRQEEKHNESIGGKHYSILTFNRVYLFHSTIQSIT